MNYGCVREPLNQSPAGATAALRDGVRERRSSTFRRKMRPRSGMRTPNQSIAAVAAPDAARPRFTGFLGR
jgi:hypothetical protein